MPALQIPYIRDYAPQILRVPRIFAASSFFTHGTMKLFNWPAPFEYPLSPLLYTAGVLEVVGGLLLAVGLFSRPVAFVLSGPMAFGYFMVHSSNAFFPVLNHGEAAMLYCFLFLYIFAAGPGAWTPSGSQGRPVTVRLGDDCVALSPATSGILVGAEKSAREAHHYAWRLAS